MPKDHPRRRLVHPPRPRGPQNQKQRPHALPSPLPQTQLLPLRTLPRSLAPTPHSNKDQSLTLCHSDRSRPERSERTVEWRNLLRAGRPPHICHSDRRPAPEFVIPTSDRTLPFCHSDTRPNSPVLSFRPATEGSGGRNLLFRAHPRTTRAKAPAGATENSPALQRWENLVIPSGAGPAFPKRPYSRLPRPCLCVLCRDRAGILISIESDPNH
jgi:hypothetical protein